MECRLFALDTGHTATLRQNSAKPKSIYLQFVSAHTPNHEEENDGAGDRHNFYPQNSRNASVCNLTFSLSLKIGLALFQEI